MGTYFHVLWRVFKRPISVIGKITVLLAVLLVAIGLINLEVKVNGTGFKGKTLWDWLQLLASLAIPVVVGFGAVWFTTRQGKVADAENKDNQRETALQAYIDKMSELLLHEKLRDSVEEDEIRKVAQVRTLTILPSIDANRKRSVLQFLYESGLIDKDTSIIGLNGVNLNGVNLSHTDLREADLSHANLFGANLSHAKLNGANLSKAILIEANLIKKHIEQEKVSRVRKSYCYGSLPLKLGVRLSTHPA